MFTHSTRRDRMTRRARDHVYAYTRRDWEHVCECQWMPGPDTVAVRTGAGRLWHRPQWTLMVHDLRLSDGYESEGVSMHAWCSQPLLATRQAGPLVVADVMSDDMVLCGKCDKAARHEGVPDLPLANIGGGCMAWDGERFSVK